MKLSDYLASKGLTAREFAAKIGLTAEAVRLLINGGRRPNSTTMQAIIKATGGAVEPNDFWDMQPPATPSPDPAPAAPAQPQERVA